MKTLIKIIFVFLLGVNINVVKAKTIGNLNDVETKTSYGIMMLGGGEEVNDAFNWLVKKANNGDIIVLATQENQIGVYEQYLFDFGADSVESILINSVDKANSAEIIEKVLKAEGIFIPGGDQHNYITHWKNTKLVEALEHLLTNKKIPIGGTSAGMAILGEFYYAPEETLTNDPLLISACEGLGNNFINIELFKNIITDTHYDNRKRQGRHIAFMALLQNNFNLSYIKGIGIDEETALCVEESGLATIYGEGNVYFHVSENSPECCEPSKPIHWNNDQKAVKTYICSKGNQFDLKKWDGVGGKWKYFFVLEGKLGCIDLVI